MKKLPIGIQTFTELRGYDYLYIDKTELIHHIIKGPKINFLSRPRRFGKSMTISTLMAIYEGKKEYFEGLWIWDKWDWNKKHPIIHISFNALDYAVLGLDNELSQVLQKIAKNYDVVLDRRSYTSMFEELIEKLNEKHGRVVILIDEYDKPIIDFLEKENRHIAHKNREILRNFYSIVKNADPYIEFFFMTGVSKFSHTGIFSNLNHLNDLTLDENYVNLVGYTPDELEFSFKEWLNYAYQRFTDDFPTFEQFMDYIRQWYNGYSWDGQQTVYNPYSILNFVAKRSFDDYWFKTGTPTFLIKLMREQQEFLFNSLTTSGRLIESYDLENLDLKTILFQTGYLTIKHINRLDGTLTLDYPNREVEQALGDYILAELLQKPYTTSSVPILQIREAFQKNDVEKAVSIINSILKSVPNQLLRGKKEDFYHALVHLHFRYLGLLMDSEVNTSDGRMDAVVLTNSHVYILEFKLNQSAEKALEQIKERQYPAKYLHQNRQVVLVGINFSSRKKAVGDWKMEIMA